MLLEQARFKASIRWRLSNKIFEEDAQCSLSYLKRFCLDKCFAFLIQVIETEKGGEHTFVFVKRLQVDFN
jgi:hypothetical protein